MKIKVLSFIKINTKLLNPYKRNFGGIAKILIHDLAPHLKMIISP